MKQPVTPSYSSYLFWPGRYRRAFNYWVSFVVFDGCFFESQEFPRGVFYFIS